MIVRACAKNINALKTGYDVAFLVNEPISCQTYWPYIDRKSDLYLSNVSMHGKVIYIIHDILILACQTAVQKDNIITFWLRLWLSKTNSRIMN